MMKRHVLAGGLGLVAAGLMATPAAAVSHASAGAAAVARTTSQCASARYAADVALNQLNHDLATGASSAQVQHDRVVYQAATDTVQKDC